MIRLRHQPPGLWETFFDQEDDRLSEIGLAFVLVQSQPCPDSITIDEIRAYLAS